MCPYTGGCMQHQPTHAKSTELSPGGLPTGFFCLTGCPSWLLGPWQACFGSLRAAGWGIEA
eukprot:1137817-Pelagomonas_calceolata.AAC.4